MLHWFDGRAYLLEKIVMLPARTEESCVAGVLFGRGRGILYGRW